MAFDPANKAAIFAQTSAVSTAFTNEAMSQVSGNLFRITNRAKRNWDIAHPLVIKDGGSPVTPVEIQLTGGYVRLAAPPYGALTADGYYFASSQVGGIIGFDLNISFETDDAGHIDDLGDKPEPMEQKWTITTDRHWWDNRASKTFVQSGSNNDFMLISRIPGARGMDLSYEQKGGISKSLGVGVNGNDIITQLQTNSSGVVTCTTNDVIKALYASEDAMRLLEKILCTEGDGSGTPAVIAHTHLEGGVDPDWFTRAIQGGKLSIEVFLNSTAGSEEKWEGIGVIKKVEENAQFGKMTKEPLTITGYDLIRWRVG